MPHRRTLSVHFERSVTAGQPNTMEVAVTPLSNPSAPALNATLVGGVQSTTVLLASDPTTVTFDLVPSDHPDLTGQVLYRIAWRERYLGRQYTTDFVMPDADVDFDDLTELGNIIGGETYLQWTDRGAPGGVAALNDSGQVVDADGNPLVTSGPTLAASLTASGGVVKTVVPVAGVNTYDFHLDTAVAVRKYSGLVVPTTGNLGVVTHNLNTLNVMVDVREAADRDPASIVSWKPNDANTVVVTFNAPPVTGQYRATVFG